MYSTRSVPGNAEASCRSAARPTAVFQPWGIKRTPLSWAIHPMRSLLANASHLGHVRLHDVQCPGLDPRLKGLTPGEHLTAGDRQGSSLAQRDIIVQGIGIEGLFEPGHIVLSQHVRRAQGPLVVAPPERVAATSVHHQQGVRSDGMACRLYDRFVELGALPPKGSPADLERLEAIGLEIREFLG